MLFYGRGKGLGHWLVPAVLAGLCYSALFVRAAETPRLSSKQNFYEVSGWVETIKPSGAYQHFTIRVTDLEGEHGPHPKRVRIRTKPHEARPGDQITIKAFAERPRGPAIVGGYDFGRASYFRQIGGTGFAVGQPIVRADTPLSFWQENARSIVRWRYQLSRHIQLRAPPETAGLQAALLTGDRSQITPEQETALRDAGLAHLLAISGLHMGLLAGGTFMMVSFLFALIPQLAGRYDMRRPASAIAVLTATLYLILSGASISTQRAYIMAVTMFMALILRRRAVSMRSVAVAAFITLLLDPSALLGAGFQMSFSATAALVAAYRFWADRRLPYQNRSGVFGRIRAGFNGTLMTSIVAGTATSGFAALHFSRLANYGLIGNMIAMPVFSLVVMPAGFLAILFLPTALADLGFLIMGKGLSYILSVSNWVTALPGAVGHIKAAAGFETAVFGLGFVLLCLGPRLFRIGGCVIIFAAFIIWAVRPVPDLRISRDGRIAYWDSAHTGILRVDRLRGDKFGRSRFAEQAGLPMAAFAPYTDLVSPCDDEACNIEIGGSRIVIASQPSALPAICADAALVVLTTRSAGPRARRLCTIRFGTQILDERDFARFGAHDITVRAGKFSVRRSNNQRRQNRPWG